VGAVTGLQVIDANRFTITTNQQTEYSGTESLTEQTNDTRDPNTYDVGSEAKQSIAATQALRVRGKVVDDLS
jgi:hypothetical protein